MTNSKKGKATLAGAIGSAAVAAALLYANKRMASHKKEQEEKEGQHDPIPSGEKPETD